MFQMYTMAICCIVGIALDCIAMNEKCTYVCMYVWMWVHSWTNEYLVYVCVFHHISQWQNFAKIALSSIFSFVYHFIYHGNKELFFILIPIQNQMMLTSWMAVQEINATKYYQGLNVIEKCSFHFCWAYIFDVGFLCQISWPSYRIMNGFESVATYWGFTENRFK